MIAQPRLTTLNGNAWTLRDDSATFDEIAAHVTDHTSRTIDFADALARQPRNQPAEQQLPLIVRATLEAVSWDLLRGNQHVLTPGFESQITKRVQKQIVRNPWYLPFGGRVLKRVVAIAVRLALGYLRAQFPAIAIADATRVAVKLQQLTERKS